MAYRGPSRTYGLGPAGDFQLEQDVQQQEFERRVKGEEMGAAAGREFAASIERMDAQRRSSDETRARLTMTPGVTRGGSTSTRSVADSPLMRGSASRFDVGGETYSYDPITAGETEGAAGAAKTGVEEKTRYEALQRIPGVRPRDAAKMVYGHAFYEDQDTSELHTALAAYTRDRTQENMARAVQAGANLNEFGAPRFDRSGRAIEQPLAPVRGTPEDLAAFQAEEDIRVGGAEREIKARAEAAPQKTDTATQRFARKKWLLSQAATLGVGDEGKTFDAIAGDARMQAEFTDLGISDAEVRAAAQGARTKSETADTRTATSLVTSGMAASPEAARAMVPRLRAPAMSAADAARARPHWDAVMSGIRTKRSHGQALSPSEEQFLREHPTRP
jgi:hypothetical protein